MNFYGFLLCLMADAIVAVLSYGTWFTARSVVRTWQRRARTEAGFLLLSYAAILGLGWGLLGLPLLALQVNVCCHDSESWQTTINAYLSLPLRKEPTVRQCAQDICYTGNVTPGGARELALLAAHLPDGTILRITSPGGEIAAMESIQKTIREHRVGVTVAPDLKPKSVTDCGSACLGILAESPMLTLDSEIRLTAHMTRRETFTPGPLLATAAGLCEQYLADDCQEKLDNALYGTPFSTADFRHNQAGFLMKLEVGGTHRVTDQLAKCTDPYPLDTIKGITFTWAQFKRIEQGEEQVNCPKR